MHRLPIVQGGSFMFVAAVKSLLEVTDTGKGID
jgi:hypothetical protein